MEIIANGQLQHHFWGTYAATIALKFYSTALALQALALPEFSGWKQHPTVPNAITFHGGGDKLKSVEATLVKLGANRTKLTSLARSIDYGEPFKIAVKLTQDTGPLPTQVGLF